MKLVRLKFHIYRWYGVYVGGFVIASLTVATVLGLRSDQSEAWKLFVTSAGALLSLAYFIQKQKLEETKVFNDLFREYNERYATLSSELAKIQDRPQSEELNDAERTTLIEYFNLCGEEYLMYSKGYIFPEVWRAWENGIGEYFQHNRIRPFWMREKESESYYGLEALDLGSAIRT